MDTVFFREWRVFALVVGIIVATGLAALMTIGRQEDPTITNLFATIVTPYPGASPARVEALVTEKIEEQLQEIEAIDEINSTSRAGISVVSVDLQELLSGEEIEQAWSEIRDALSDASRQFPSGVPEPEFDNDRTGAFTAISAISMAPGVDHSPTLLRRYGELLQDRMRQIGGAEFVDIFGAAEEEILVQIDPVRLASLGLSPADVSAAIRGADAKVQAGQVRDGRGDLLIEVAGEIETVDRIAQIPVGADSAGGLFRVGDIAEIKRSIKSPSSSLAYANGTPAVLVATRMAEGLRVDLWADAVKQDLAEFELELPAGMQHDLLFDQSEYTNDRLSGLVINLLIGVGLVLTVLLFTLGWRGAFIVAIVLPLASLLSLNVLNFAGVPIHQMSVSGMIVALGLLVDAAIVMTDEVRRRVAGGMPRLNTVRAAVRRLAIPLFASTLTTILAFMPMALLPGPAGDFVGSIAIAVIVMLTASFLLALTVTPALAGWILKADPTDDSPWWDRGIRAGAVGRIFARSIDLSLAHPRLAIMAAVALPIIGFAAFPSLTSQFFPGVDRDQFHVQLQLDGATSIQVTEQAALAAGQIISADKDVRSVHWVIGESAPAFYYNMMMDQDGDSGFAEALVTTTSPEATARIIPALQAELDARLPEAQIIVQGLKQGPPVAAPVEVRVVGPELQTLRDIGEQMRALMTQVPSIIHTKADMTGGAPKIVFELDEDEVQLAGLNLTGVATQIEGSLEGAVGGSLVETTEELPVRVRLGDAERGAFDTIRALDVVGPDGRQQAASGTYPGIPLSALGAPQLVPSESPIQRLNGDRINNVRGYLAHGVLPEEALQAFQARLADASIALPPGYSIEFGGDSEERADTVSNLMSSMGLIITLTIATIVLTFNSFRLSLVTGVVAILSMGLSLFALAVFQFPFGIQALIGVIGSIGVSINAAIIILTSLQQDTAAMAGDRTQIRELVVRASRHIISTTTTTFGGFLPLIMAGGGFWPPFAMAIAGGVLLSTIVSFYFTPTVFSLWIAGARTRPANVNTPVAGRPPIAA